MSTAILIILLACALVVIGYLVFLFVDIRTHFKESSYTSLPEPHSQDFFQALVGMSQAQVGSARLELIDDSHTFFDRFIADIYAAEKSISIMVYIWEAGELSTKLFTALTDACKRGVSVRVMVDYHAAKIADDPGYNAFLAAGGRFYFFRKPHIWELPRYYRRNHQRSFVIDGSLAYTGGVAVRDDWYDPSIGHLYWRDSMVRGEGIFARHLQSIFARHWTATTGEMLAGDAFYPALRSDAKDPTLHEPGESYRYACFSSVPGDDLYPAQFAVTFALASAQKEIVIATPYFIPTPQLLRLLERKAESGVRVIIITLAEATDMEQVTRQASHVSYGSLLASGGEIYEYSPSLYHVKSIVIDGEVAILGTVNFDIRSMKLNDEVVVVVQSEAFAGTVRASLERDRLVSNRIEKDPWERRGFLKRAVEKMIAPFSEQL